jgi:hypothetical protein
MRDRLYVGKPFNGKSRRGQVRDVVALKVYLRTIGEQLGRAEARRATVVASRSSVLAAASH